LQPPETYTQALLREARRSGKRWPALLVIILMLPFLALVALVVIFGVFALFS
jgi:hypothetical protein